MSSSEPVSSRLEAAAEVVTFMSFLPFRVQAPPQVHQKLVQGP